MSTCSCSPSSLATVRFASGLVLVRCATHEQQAWQVEGRTTDRAEALAGLRQLFVDSRRRTAADAPTRRRAAAAPADLTVVGTSTAPESWGSSDDPDAGTYPTPSSDQLTALLRSRGLQGSWAVA